MIGKGGDIECAATVEAVEGGRAAVVTYEAPQSKVVEAHLPLLMIAVSIRTEKGGTFALTDAELVLGAGNVGASFDLGHLRVSTPEGASVRRPARQYNSYTKDVRRISERGHKSWKPYDS